MATSRSISTTSSRSSSRTSWPSCTSHVEAALDPAVTSEEAGGGPTSREVDVDDVRAVYRAVVLLTMCMSQAVVPVDGASRGGVELMA